MLIVFWVLSVDGLIVVLEFSFLWLYALLIGVFYLSVAGFELYLV